MDINVYLKAVLESEQSSVVLCDLKHTVVYMNPFAIERYHKDMTGSNLMDCHNEESRHHILESLEWFRKSPENNRVYEFYNIKDNRDVYMYALRDEKGTLIGYWEKHAYRDREQGAFYDYTNTAGN